MRRLAWLALLGAVVSPGCGDRPSAWDAVPDGSAPLATRGALALVDSNAHRVLMLPVEGDLDISPVAIPIGRNVAPGGAAVTTDGSRLVVLSRGDTPRRNASDQGPRLQLIDGGTSPTLTATYDLPDALSGLTLDPASRFAVVRASDADASFVTDPNELSVIDLSLPPSLSNPATLSLRSTGGKIERLDFTEPLELATGTKRLLIVQSDRDVSVLDLGAPVGSQIAIKLTGGTDQLRPAGVAVSDGEPGQNDDARLAIRLATDPNVVLVDLLPPGDDPAAKNAAFRPLPNVVGVGATVSDLAFLRTDGGLRVGALVPSQHKLSLIEPATGIVTDLDLGAIFTRLSVVTSDTPGAAGTGDTALLWSDISPTIAFLSLGQSVGKPYRSVEALPLPEPISEVLAVPAPFQSRRLLTSATGRNFYVLDLADRSITPLQSTGAQLFLSPSGQRAWAFQSGEDQLAAIDLATGHPQNLVLDRSIAGLFEVTRRDGGSALVAYHAGGTGGLTILDAAAPSLLHERRHESILLEALP
jgi:DNA-binding beta-propeller fold protein YncE